MTIRVAVVDDSLTMRHLISAVLSADPEIEIVGTASDPLEARALIKAVNPDVLTLDVEMPNMNGLEFLEKIMRLRPMPVVMVSTLTHAGTEIALAALELGAVDVVGKPSGILSADSAFPDLISKVKSAARARVRALATRQEAPNQSDFVPAPGHIIALGASTGGVEALLSVIAHFPANCPPTVITQHMPGTFTPSFAARLNKVSAAQVTEARDGAPLAIGQIFLAPGGDAHLEVVGGRSPRCKLTATDLVNGHRPSVDVLFHSVARLGLPATGAILTGMGRDGAQGLLAMRQAGASTFGQDEASSVVYGMPKAAAEIGAVNSQLPIHRMAAAILAASASTP